MINKMYKIAFFTDYYFKDINKVTKIIKRLKNI